MCALRKLPLWVDVKYNQPAWSGWPRW